MLRVLVSLSCMLVIVLQSRRFFAQRFDFLLGNSIFTRKGLLRGPFHDKMQMLNAFFPSGTDTNSRNLFSSA